MIAHIQSLVLLFLVCIQAWAVGPEDNTLTITSLPPEGLLLDKHWKYQAGDDIAWAEQNFDDRAWQSINPTDDIHDLPLLWQNQIGWLRLCFTIDSALSEESLALMVEQIGASEIYLNGRLIKRYGQFSDGTSETEAVFLPSNEFIPFRPMAVSQQVLAIRFELQTNILYVNFAGWKNRPEVLRIVDTPTLSRLLRQNSYYLFYIQASVFFMLALLHLVLFLNGPKQKANLYFFGFALLSTLNFSICGFMFQYVHMAAPRMYLLILIFALCTSSYFFFLMASYSIFGQRRGLLFKCISGVFVFSLPSFLIFYQHGSVVGLMVLPMLVFLDSARLSFLIGHRHNPRVKIVRYGAIAYLLLYPLSMAFYFGLLPIGPNEFLGNIAFNLGFLSLPLTLSVYLATEASFISRSLELKLVEVKNLTEKTVRQEMEKQKMQEIDQVKSRFFANISHEFRTPLSLIRGIVEKLSTKEIAPEKQSDYGVILRSAGRLLQMVNQLLDLSRLESGKLTLQQKPVNISAQLKMVGSSFASLFETKCISYRYTVPMQAVWAQLDPEKLEQIAGNMLSNAAKFTPAGGDVQFTATVKNEGTQGCSLTLQVEDTGIGISPDHTGHIFERFYQVNAIHSYEGTGIGLALVKELTELQGGNVAVRSIEGKGTTFEVRLPLAIIDRSESIEVMVNDPDQVIAVPLQVKERLTANRAARVGNDARHILLVEDNQDLREFMARYLSEFYRVSEAENGIEGFDQAVEIGPDVIISDVMMAGMDGVSLCAKLKEDPRTSHIPVVLLTAKADAESRNVGLQHGADDYITKPFGTDELCIRIDNLMRQRQKLQEKFSHTLTLQPQEIIVASADERFLQRVLAVMEENIGSAAFDVDTFSKTVGVSRAQLNRKLNTLADQSPSEFIRTFRLKRAKSLLQNQAGNVSEVAYLVGYTNLAHFSKAFRDYHSMTPSECIAQHGSSAKNESKI